MDYQDYYSKNNRSTKENLEIQCNHDQNANPVLQRFKRMSKTNLWSPQVCKHTCGDTWTHMHKLVENFPSTILAVLVVFSLYILLAVDKNGF